MLKKVISGGQTGADQAGLRAARKVGLETGGFAPHKYKTSDGPNRTLLAHVYGLVESDGDYKKRTWQNVEASQGTVRLCVSFETPGEKCTYNAIKHYKKPYFDIDLLNPKPIEECVKWLRDNQIEVLNVAGNTEGTKGHGIGIMVFNYLLEVFERMKHDFQRKN